MEVRLGSSQPDQGGEVRKVKQIYLHEGQSLIDNDFALLELETPITFSETIQPAKLPQANYDIPDGTMLSSSGWGATFEPQSVWNLRRVELPKVNIDYCLKTNHLNGNHREQKICAGFDEDGKSICIGDYGGPLTTADGTLVGIASFIRDCGKKQYPGIYSRVTTALDWINSIVNN